MDQYGVAFGTNGDPTRIVVWGQENPERVHRRALRDALLKGSVQYVVTRAEVHQDLLPFFFLLLYRTCRPEEGYNPLPFGNEDGYFSLSYQGQKQGRIGSPHLP